MECIIKEVEKDTLRELSTENVMHKKAFLGWICRKVRERTVEMIGKGGRVLDLGCGNGLFIAMLGLKGLDKNRILGVDFSQYLLMEAKTVFSSNDQEGIPLIKGDFFRTPFKDSTFENIVSLNTLVNLNQQGLMKLLKEMKRILKSSGKIYVDIRNEDNPLIKLRYLKSGSLLIRGYRLNDFIEKLNDVGLNVSKFEYIGFKARALAFAYLLEIVKENKE